MLKKLGLVAGDWSCTFLTDPQPQVRSPWRQNELLADEIGAVLFFP
jgi:hypothetical protein